MKMYGLFLLRFTDRWMCCALMNTHVDYTELLSTGGAWEYLFLATFRFSHTHTGVRGPYMLSHLTEAAMIFAVRTFLDDLRPATGILLLFSARGRPENFQRNLIQKPVELFAFA